MKKMLTSGGSFDGIKLMQAVDLKSPVENKKPKTFFYARHLSFPGAGLPPSIVYGKISAQLLIQYLNDERKI
jgi:phytoene desaturase